MIKTIHTNKAPQAIGPYSQAVQAGGFLFLSGQIPIIPETGEVVNGDVVAQTQQVMHNIKAILETEGIPVQQIVKTTIYVKDLSEFSKINEAYAKALDGHHPARSTVEVSRLPKDVSIEIDVIARKS